MPAEFRQLKQKDEFIAAYELIKLQQPTLSEAEYWRLLGEMMFAGQLFAGLYLQNTLIGVVGIRKGADWLYGEHLWLHILILAPNYREQGYEKMLLDFVLEWAKAQDCEHIYSTLDLATVQGTAAGFVTSGQLFTLNLNTEKPALFTSGNKLPNS